MKKVLRAKVPLLTPNGKTMCTSCVIQTLPVMHAFVV